MIGVTNKSTMAMLISGKRCPGKKLMTLLVKYFEFNSQEKIHFERLVLYSTTKNKGVTSQGVLDMLEDKILVAKKKFFSDEQVHTLSDWRYFVLKELSVGKALDDSSSNVQFYFPVGDFEANSAMGKLLELGLVKNEDFSHEDDQVEIESSKDDIPCDFIKKYHRSSIELSKQAVDKFDVDQRYISSLVMNMNPEKFSALKTFLISMENEMSVKYADNSANTTYMINLQAFPVAELKG